MWWPPSTVEPLHESTISPVKSAVTVKVVPETEIGAETFDTVQLGVMSVSPATAEGRGTSGTEEVGANGAFESPGTGSAEVAPVPAPGAPLASEAAATGTATVVSRAATLNNTRARRRIRTLLEGPA